MKEAKAILGKTTSLIAIALSIFHLYTGVFGLLPGPQQRAVHVALALTLIFLISPVRMKGIKKGVPWYDLLIISVVLMSCGYVFFFWKHYLPFMVFPPNAFEIIIAVTTILAVLEAGRRTTGWAFPILAMLTFAYALVGHYIPGEFNHPPIGIILTLKSVYFSVDGVWGFLTGLSATFIALFILFGATLLASGGGKTLIDLAMLTAGRLRGGPAKVAVVASGFFGMLSGSAVANVATTGSFTIPMMKKLGYSPEFAGGVESTASTGGQIAPPIMGVAAFVMAEFLGIPYLKVCIAAIVPAILFFLAVFMGVHFQAVKQNLAAIRHEDLPLVKNVVTFSRMLTLILPIGVLLYTLIEGYSLNLVGSSAALTCLATYTFSGLSLHSIKERLKNIPSILESAGKTLIRIVPILVCANIVLCLLSFTGLSIKFSAMVMRLGESSIFLSLLMTGVLVMILGCGLPSTPAYILGVTVAAPMLIGWGILPIAAHLFIFYYAVIAVITPPVCPAVYMATAIAQSNWLKTAWVAVRLSPLLYLMPFLFVFDNTFLLMGSPRAILLNLSTAILGAVILVSGTIGQLITKCKHYESLALVAAGILLLIPGWQTDLLGVVLLSAIGAKQFLQKRKEFRTKMI